MPSPSQPLRRSTRSRSRVEQAEAVVQAQGSSVAATARARGIARRTLRGWLRRKVALAEAPGASTFAQSPEGTRALHRIVLAAIVVFGVMHGGLASCRAHMP
jgi:transposase-like protein